MRVEIIDIKESAAGARLEVRSEHGQFPARWDGEPPSVGTEYNVELGFDERFTWGVDVVPVDAHPHAIGPGARDGVVLWATVEQLDDGGFVGLRLGTSVIMTEADGAPPPVGTTVRLEAPAVTLFDTGD
jgi:hypothetical protein